jgi:4-diphosphocytidyl-2-C-methyl-D-erythritol kinase
MLQFCPCKINLGLNVVEKRADGFHNLETTFYPIQWRDSLEIIESSESQGFELSLSGLRIEGNPADNIIYKAYQLIKQKHRLPSIKVHLHKNIPMGAGLGGGSSNGAVFINLLDKKFNLGISLAEKTNIAGRLGSDCSFFIEQKPVYATGKGDVFEPLNINLGKYFILLVYPGIHSNTKTAYAGVNPSKPQKNIKDILENYPIQEWKSLLVNDFEASVFKAFPEIENLKQQLYNNGAIYACMSGSGSTVFGIFENRPSISFPAAYNTFLQEPVQEKI